MVINWMRPLAPASVSCFQVWPLSLIVKKVRSRLFRFPSLFPISLSSEAYRHFFCLSPPSLSVSSFPLFSLDQLIMSEKEGHYPEVISWMLSGWCISPAWWRNTLFTEGYPFLSFLLLPSPLISSVISKLMQIFCVHTGRKQIPTVV